MTLTQCVCKRPEEQTWPTTDSTKRMDFTPVRSTASDSRNNEETKIEIFTFSSRDHSPHICLTWYPSNPPLNFSRSEANTFRSKVKQSVCPELVERVQVTRASIGVLYLFLPSHERAYSLLVFSLRLPSFRFIPLYYTSLHLF